MEIKHPDLDEVEFTIEMNDDKSQFKNMDEYKPITASSNNIHAIVSRIEVLGMISNVKHEQLKEFVLISISSENSPTFYEEYRTLFNDFISLEYNDNFPPFEGGLQEEKEYSEKIKKEIYNKKLFDFIEKNNGKKFIIHCNEGISRSPAIGMLLEMYLNEVTDKDEYIKNSDIYNHRRYEPNIITLKYIDIPKRNVFNLKEKKKQNVKKTKKAFKQ